MRISNTLYSLLLVLPVGACAKSGSTPQSESAYEVAQSVPVQEAPDEKAEGLANTVSDPRPMGDAPPPLATEPAAEGATLSDAQIVKITNTVNEGEIAQAKVAQQKSKDPDVRKFAKHMIDEHTKAEKKGDAWAKHAKVSPEDSSVATGLQHDGEKTLASINEAGPSDIDKTYIEAQVAQHEAVLDLLDHKLIPGATLADLKASLEKTRTMVEKHVTQAKALQQKLGANQNKGAAGSAAAPSAG